MLSSGKKITQSNDKLYRIDIQRIVNALKNPPKGLVEVIKQLQTLQAIDVNAYRKLKTRLPYVVPSLFNPPFRRKENFISSQYLILDIDHVSLLDDIDVQGLKNKLKSDKRILLMFVSPGGNGIKIFFGLQKPCFDVTKYSIFYKNFAQDFAKNHNIEKVVDFTTNDVTRACFMSVDKDFYFNQAAERLNIDDFADFNEIFFVKEYQKESKKLAKIDRENNKIQMSKDELLEIKSKLNPEFFEKKARKKEFFVPPEIEKVLDDLRVIFLRYNLDIKEFRSIHYGKKIIFSYKNAVAEINIFYGKKGFSVVRSPKSGTNKDLMEIGYNIVSEFFFNIKY